MDINDKLERLISPFEEFLSILEENNGQNFTRGIKGILAIFMDTNCSVEDRLEEAKSDYKSMMGGMGTLGDFAIYPNNETERILANRLNTIESEIWKLLDLSLSHLPEVVDEVYTPGRP